ncbi:MAG: PAS domain-containing protein [Deltaproteobacteria bacterium]|nr:PAS domain-containing protein [Deltaproteobacteria bacterium]
MSETRTIETPDAARRRGDGDDSRQQKEFLFLDRQRVINIIRGMGESLIVLNPDATIRFVNRAAEEMLGYGARELVGRPIGCVAADDDLEFFRLLKSMVTDGPVRNFSLNYIDRRGEKIPVNANGSVLRDSEGKVAGIVVVAADMRKTQELIRGLEEAKSNLEEKVRERTGELERAYKDLKDAESQLLQREKMASIGQLAAGMAHEINNPIGFIMSNMETLKSYVDDIVRLLEEYGALRNLVSGRKDAAFSPDIGEGIRKIEELAGAVDHGFIVKDAVKLIRESREGAERVKRIVSELKDFSRIDCAGVGPVNLNECLESALNMARRSTGRDVRVHRDYGDIPEVTGNPMELNHVFLNIIANAVDAAGPNGEIRVSTALAGPGAEFAEVSVSDNGRGITEENMARIFEPFFTTKPVGGGTGLGLSIAYGIVKRHGGEIRADSRADEGATFTIRLPVKG